MEVVLADDPTNSDRHSTETIPRAPSHVVPKHQSFTRSLLPKSLVQFFSKSRLPQDPNQIPVDFDELDVNYRIMPLAIGCILPASILINVPSLTSGWVGRPEYDPSKETWGPPEVIPVPHWMSGMVIAALIMAVVCNICVLCRFLERNVWHSVVLSLITASIQDVLCLGAIVPFCLMYPTSEGYVYLEGFWAMVASLIFSATATVLISIDLHQTPQFHLQGSGVTHKQRMLIAQAMALCFYLAVGALIFIWIEDWTFLESLFFVMITITTIGFGDTVPKTAGGRAFVIFYASGGIVIFAMAVNAIRYVILEDMHRQFAVRARERKAKKAARRQERKEERQREIERKKRTQEAIENIRKMEALQNQTEGASTETHHSSIFRRHFTVPHGVGLRLPALFHRRGSDVTAKSQNVSNIFTTESTVKERSPTYGSSTSTESIQLRTPIRDDPVGEGHLKAIQNAPEDADTIKGDNIQRYRYFPKGLRESVVRWYIVFGRICGFKKAADCARIAAPMANLKKQREADKELAYKESMQEYRRRLRFSFGMFMCFWLLGAVIYRTVEPWSYGQAMYFSFVAFSSIGYGDLVPLSLAGRAIFLAYCLIGIVTLTSLASIISEVLSKSLRRHVVQTQLRRSERFAEQRHNIERRVSDTDLEQGVTAAEDHENGFSSENDQHMERMQTLQTLATTVAAGLSDSSRSPDSSQGSLRNLVQVSRDFDTLLQKVLGLDYASDNIPTATTNVGNSSNTNAKISLPLEPDRILDYLEKEEEELSDSSFFSPSISRDITSTSSIHRNTLATLGRNFMDLKANGTYHGPGPSTSSNTSSSESQFNIRAWPNSPSVNSIRSHPDNERHHPPQIHHKTLHRHIIQPASSSSSAATKSASITAHRHNADGSVTISAIHWRHLIEYSKQFRILTNTCEEALQKLLVWEATESRMRMRRRLIRERQKRILQTRRRRMFELGGTYGAIDDDIEDEEELEELDEWFGEGDSNNDDGYEEDNEENNIDDLDQDQEGIAKTLLGSIGVEQSTPIRKTSKSRSRYGREPSPRRRHRSRSRSRISHDIDRVQYASGVDIGGGCQMCKSSKEDSSITTVVDPVDRSERVPRALHDGRGGTRTRRRSTSRNNENRFGDIPGLIIAEYPRRSGSETFPRRPQLHTIHTGAVPSHMSSEVQNSLVPLDNPSSSSAIS